MSWHYVAMTALAVLVIAGVAVIVIRENRANKAWWSKHGDCGRRTDCVGNVYCGHGDFIGNPDSTDRFGWDGEYR